MSNKNKQPVIRTGRDALRYKQAIDNIALCVIEGKVTLDDVAKQVSESMYQLILNSVNRIDELREMYAYSSTLEGVDEYLDPNSFTFSNTSRNITH